MHLRHKIAHRRHSENILFRLLEPLTSEKTIAQTQYRFVFPAIDFTTEFPIPESDHGAAFSMILRHGGSYFNEQYRIIVLWFYNRRSMGDKADVLQGTLALMVLKTLEVLGPLHGYGIARRIEQTSGDLLSLNYGTLYPALLKLEQEGAISSEWGFSDNNRKAKFYKLTRAGRKQLEKETRNWEQTAAILAKFLAV
jgi:PadR family transcriptional regulator PadR